MSEHEWKIGDWASGGISQKRWFIVRIDGGLRGVSMQDDAIHMLNEKHVVHLPDCTGWDWQPPKPIEPPEGYRLLGRDSEEIIKPDFMHLGTMGFWNYSLHFVGKSVRLAMAGNEFIEAFARKIEPQYRPFANAAEFRQHRLRWWKYKGESNCLIRPPVCYSDRCHDGRGWDARFNECEFEDGTPFGIKVE